MQPWQGSWAKLLANSHAQPSWTPNPLATVYRGTEYPENYGTLYNDIAAAYQNALHWKISGDTACAATAANICNAWADTLTTIDGSADRFLAAGIYGYQFANVGELMRGYSGYDHTAFKNMMYNVFYPLNDSFLTNHNGAYITNYWANWDLCTMASIIAIGILCDDDSLIARTVDYFYNGAGQGSLYNAAPYVYDSEGLAQWQESGRDQGHTTLGIGLMGAVCEMAWNQGYDLYGADSNRFLKACEYVAKYNLGYDVPFTPYTVHVGAPGVWEGWNTYSTISSSSRGNTRPVWELVYGHYVGRKGLSAPYTARYASQTRPEGGGGDYGSTSGGYDQFGFGTLTATRTSSALSAGVYTFTNEYSGKNLDNGSTSTEGAQVMQWTPNSSANSQRWRLTDAGNGYWTLTSLYSGKCLDNGNTTTEGGKALQWTANGGTPQQWKISDAGNGCYTLLSRMSGKDLDNASGTADGAGCVQWTVNYGTPQRWRAVKVA
ncbi:RICIN domain-containing protein [Streptomyces sp. AS02]|nr:RICIN domain-containing protein [Streptomyces sp. AS02]